MDDLTDCERFLACNPPVYALIGDYFEVRRSGETIAATAAPPSPVKGTRDDLKEISRIMNRKQ